MADQVTVSTFLELKDNMSSGFAQLNKLLKDVYSSATKTTGAIKNLNKTVQSSVAAIKTQQAAVAGLNKKSIFQKNEASKIEAKTQSSLRNDVLRTERFRRAEEQKSLSTSIGIATKRAALARPIEVPEGSTLSFELSTANEQVDNLIAAGASLAAVYSLSSAVTSALELNKQYENLQDRISGTLVATKMASSIDLAQKKSARVLALIRDQAAALPGEAQEYAENFALALPKTLASGMTNLTQAADFISKYTAVAIANGVDAAQAGRDLMLMLTGTVDSQARSYQVLSEKIGLSTEKFNKLDAVARRETVQKAITSYGALLDKVGLGFDAQVGAVTSAVKDVILLASQPMFEQSKRVLAEINSWIEKNKKALVATGRVIGTDISAAFNAVLKVAQWLGEHIDGVYRISKLFFEIWASTKIIAGVAAIIKAMRALRASIVAVRTASIAAGLASAAAPAVGAVAGAAVRAGGTAAAASGFNPWVVGGVIVTTAAATAYSQYSQNREKEYELAKEQFAMQQKASAFDAALRRSDAAAIKNVFVGGGGVSHQFRRVLLDVAQTHKDILPADVTSEAFFESLVQHQKKISPRFGLTEDILKAYAAYRDFDYDVASGLVTPEIPQETLKETPKGRTATVNDFRFSRFDIKQEFAEGFDPDRIAVAFASDLARLGEFKMQSMNATTFSSTTQ